MALPEYEPQAESDVPKITLLREFNDGQMPVYHFYVDGEESSVTLTREDIDGDSSCYSYHFRFYDWEFASADIKSWPHLTVVENEEISDDLDDLAKLEAERLMTESAPFLITAISTDFPEAYAIEDTNGRLV